MHYGPMPLQNMVKDWPLAKKSFTSRSLVQSESIVHYVKWSHCSLHKIIIDLLLHAWVTLETFNQTIVEVFRHVLIEVMMAYAFWSILIAFNKYLHHSFIRCVCCEYFIVIIYVGEVGGVSCITSILFCKG